MRRILWLLRQIVLKIREKGGRETLAIVLRRGADYLTRSAFTNPSKQDLAPSIPSLPLNYEIILAGLHHHKSLSKQNSLIQSSPNKYLHFVWIIPFFSRGSGGHKNLFRFVKGLEALGHKCTIYVVEEYKSGLGAQEMQNLIREYFELIDAEVKIFDSKQIQDESADIVVATAWITAYAALMFAARLKIYFVQDYEPLFFSSGSYWHLAKNTYQFGFYHLTLGPWLTNVLRKQHEVAADFYDIVLDKNLYYPREQITNPAISRLNQQDGLKICFYGRSSTPRRCFEIVVMALYLATQKEQNLTIICYGCDEIPLLPFEYTNLGVLEVEDLAELYSISDICIAPSSTNLALVAHEVMACGCILMDLAAENTALNLTHLLNSYLVQPDPQAMCDGLLDLFHNPQLRNEIKKNSLIYSQQLKSWEQQIKTFEQLVKSRLNSSDVVPTGQTNYQDREQGLYSTAKT
jgi:glycosyltransferase involved in cell wall biosynthesis